MLHFCLLTLEISPLPTKWGEGGAKRRERGVWRGEPLSRPPTAVDLSPITGRGEFNNATY
jgi:hypothetical protein